MRHKGPILTLAAGLVLAAVLMVLNLKATNTGAQAPTGGEATAPTATKPPTATAAPTKAPPANGPTVTYAGDVEGGSATVAIAVKNGKAVAYLCDGDDIEAWLQGTAEDGQLDLRGEGNASLTGTFGNGIARGSISAEGSRFTFSAKTVKPPSGLYRATANLRNKVATVGWVVKEDGSQTGVMDLGGTEGPAPELNTATNSAVVDGVTISAQPVDGTGL
jgi:hypothetical protein